MFNFLKHFDLLPTNIHLNVQGNSRIKSRFGGLLCLVLIILGISGFSYFLSKILDRSEPIVSYNKLYVNESSYILNTSDTIFAFKISDQYGKEVDDTLYSARAEYWQYMYIQNKEGVINRTYNVKSLNVSKCIKNFNSTSGRFRELYNTVNLNNHYCLDPGEYLEIKNPFGAIYDYSFINIYFTHCSHRSDCKNSTYIDKQLSSFYAETVVENYYVDNLDFENPLRPYVHSYVELSSSSFYKRVYYEINEIIHSSDGGILFQSSNKQSKNSFYNVKSYIDYRDVSVSHGKLLYQFTYCFNQEAFQETYARNYKKIQHVLAEIGGFINAFKIIFSIISTIYIEIIYVPIVYEGFTFFLNPNENKLNKNNIPDSIINIRNKIFNDLSNVNLDTAKNIKFQQERLPTKFEIIKRCLCIPKMKSKDNSLYYLAKKKLKYKYLDFSAIIKMRNELNFMKQYLIRNTVDEELYDFCSKSISIHMKEYSKTYAERRTMRITTISNWGFETLQLFNNYLKNS